MNVKRILELFNEYSNRIRENIVTCGKTAMSIRLEDKIAFAANACKESALEEKDIVIISVDESADNQLAELHRRIYKVDKAAQAVIHTNTPYAQAIGQAGMRIPAVLDDTAQIIGIDVRTTKDSVESILKALKKRKGAIIKGSGTITCGRSLDEAYAACLVLEKAAKCFISANILGGYKRIPYIEAVLMHFIYQKKYSKANQSMLRSKIESDRQETESMENCSGREMELRCKIVDAGIRLLNSNLVQGTWGNISIRLDDQHMLITPSGLDYLSLKPADIVKVNINTMEYEGKLKPSGEKDIHAMLLKSRKDINVIMHSHPNECSAFAVSRKELPVDNADMEKYVKGSARVSKYALPSTMGLAKATVEAMQGRNACFMANHGMLAVGVDVEDTFECCRIMEHSAGEYIDNKAAALAADGKTSEEKRIKAFGTIIGK